MKSGSGLGSGGKGELLIVKESKKKKEKGNQKYLVVSNNISSPIHFVRLFVFRIPLSILVFIF